MTAIRIELPLKETQFCCVHRRRRVNTHYFIHFIFLSVGNQRLLLVGKWAHLLHRNHPRCSGWVDGGEICSYHLKRSPIPALQLCPTIPASGLRLTSYPQVHQAFTALSGPFTGQIPVASVAPSFPCRKEWIAWNALGCCSIVGCGWGLLRGEVTKAPTLSALWEHKHTQCGLRKISWNHGRQRQAQGWWGE